MSNTQAAFHHANPVAMPIPSPNAPKNAGRRLSWSSHASFGVEPIAPWRPGADPDLFKKCFPRGGIQARQNLSFHQPNFLGPCVSGRRNPKRPVFISVGHRVLPNGVANDFFPKADNALRATGPQNLGPIEGNWQYVAQFLHSVVTVPDWTLKIAASLSSFS